MGITKPETVCVTGAGGFLGSWLVHLLLSKDFIVHGTVREPDDHKYSHLKKLEKASENLKLFKADLLDYDSLCPAIAGCSGVFHVACPVPSLAPNFVLANPEVNMIEPAVTGTLNVLKACHEARVKRVVIVSSIVSLLYNPTWPDDVTKDESCWSNKEYCRTNKLWYPLAKTESEIEAFEFASKTGLDIVSVCPALVFGPLLQPSVNASSMVLVDLLKGVNSKFKTMLLVLVDVRDVAEALLLVYVKPEAKGRYFCGGYTVREQDLVNTAESLFPNYSYPTSFIEVELREVLSSEKLQKLGWSYRPLEETLIDSVESYRNSGVLH